MVLAKTAYSGEHDTKFIDLYHAWLLSNREYRRTTMGLSTLYKGNKAYESQFAPSKGASIQRLKLVG